MSFEMFKQQFRFCRKKAGLIGVERERFLLKSGCVVAEAPRVLPYLWNMVPDLTQRFGCELSACQLEDRTPPIGLQFLTRTLASNDAYIMEALADHDLTEEFYPVGPVSMPLDVYPDAGGRYAAIVSKMSEEVRRAACRAAGIHVHVGMPDHAQALHVYNKIVQSSDAVEQLMSIGDLSNGARLQLYQCVTSLWQPRCYKNWEAFHADAMEHGYAYDPRQNWALLRITLHGTLEFRMFDATAEIDTICAWAKVCHKLCMG